MVERCAQYWHGIGLYAALQMVMTTYKDTHILLKFLDSYCSKFSECYTKNMGGLQPRKSESLM